MRQQVVKLIPNAILRAYKKRAHAKIIKRTTVKDEPDLFMAKKFCRKDKIVLDIGANVGLYTNSFSPCAKKVIALEPIPESVQILKHIIKKFELSNVEVLEKAVSDTTGIGKMYIPVIGSKENLYRASIHRNKEEVYSAVQVSLTTIDNEFFEFADEINFIKCDIEGHELACIKGSRKLLNKSKPTWMIEVSGNPDRDGTNAMELLKLMSSYGYIIFKNRLGRLIERKKGDSEINYFFIHENKFNDYAKLISTDS